MADQTVMGHIVAQERARRAAVARGEADPVVSAREAADAAADDAAGPPGVLVRFEHWMSTDWEFGPYYWEAPPDQPPPGRWTRAGHWAWWGSEKTLRGMEFVGEVVANVFGMNESRFQWVIDAQRDEERRVKQRALEDAQRRELARAAADRDAAAAEAAADRAAADRRAGGDVEA